MRGYKDCVRGGGKEESEKKGERKKMKTKERRNMKQKRIRRSIEEVSTNLSLEKLKLVKLEVVSLFNTIFLVMTVQIIYTLSRYSNCHLWYLKTLLHARAGFMIRI